MEVITTRTTHFPAMADRLKEDTVISSDAYRVMGAHKAVSCSLSTVMKWESLTVSVKPCGFLVDLIDFSFSPKCEGGVG